MFELARSGALVCHLDKGNVVRAPVTPSKAQDEPRARIEKAVSHLLIGVPFHQSGHPMASVGWTHSGSRDIHIIALAEQDQDRVARCQGANSVSAPAAQRGPL